MVNKILLAILRYVTYWGPIISSYTNHMTVIGH